MRFLARIFYYLADLFEGLGDRCLARHCLQLRDDPLSADWEGDCGVLPVDFKFQHGEGNRL